MFAGGIFRAAGSRRSGENALDLIRGVVSDRHPIRLSGLKCSCSKRCAFCLRSVRFLRSPPRRSSRWVRGPPKATRIAASNGWCRRPIRLSAAHAILFRPPGEGPFPLAIVAHATSQNVLRRAQMPQPEYRALAAWLVTRGFAVLVPERPGHGATGGRLPRRSRRLRRGGLCQGRARDGGLHRSGAGFYARAILPAAGRRGDRRPLRGRMGRAGACRSQSARRLGDHRVRAGTRRPCQRSAQSGLRAAHADLPRRRSSAKPRGCR